MDTIETVKSAFDDFQNDKFMDAKDKIRSIVQQKVQDKLTTELGLEKPVEQEITGDDEE